MADIQTKNIGSPDEKRAFGRGSVSVVKLGDFTAGLATFEPGWRWSEHVKPIAGTASCQVHHNCVVVSGRMGIRMDSGEEVEVGPGDVFVCPAGHDAWVIGDEPCVAWDVSGAATYATKA